MDQNPSQHKSQGILIIYGSWIIVIVIIASSHVNVLGQVNPILRIRFLNNKWAFLIKICMVFVAIIYFYILITFSRKTELIFNQSWFLGIMKYALFCKLQDSSLGLKQEGKSKTNISFILIKWFEWLHVVILFCKKKKKQHSYAEIPQTLTFTSRFQRTCSVWR